MTNEEIDVKAISNSLGHSKTIITVDVYTDKKQMIVDVSEQTQEFACEIFPITYLQEQQVEEAIGHDSWMRFIISRKDLPKR